MIRPCGGYGEAGCHLRAGFLSKDSGGYGACDSGEVAEGGGAREAAGEGDFASVLLQKQLYNN